MRDATSRVLRLLSENILEGTLPVSFAHMSSMSFLCAGSLAAALFGLDWWLRSSLADDRCRLVVTHVREIASNGFTGNLPALDAMPLLRVLYGRVRATSTPLSHFYTPRPIMAARILMRRPH
jgi:hypothetical protein